ncbi:hypothetical protein H9L39_03277 [Fusarium oxysporum f. sp. albedinis]|nr:hypothetical protein H9L39_03277 [Fusarium oxysporum f. sp. albedinis]
MEYHIREEEGLTRSHTATVIANCSWAWLYIPSHSSHISRFFSTRLNRTFTLFIPFRLGDCWIARGWLTFIDTTR